MTPTRSSRFNMRNALQSILVATIVVALAPARSHTQSAPFVRSDTTIKSFDGREMKGEVLRLTVPERHFRPASLMYGEAGNEGDGIQ